MFEGMQLGTVFQGGTLITVIGAALVALRYWIQGSPERARVRNERKTIDMAEVDKLLADYSVQIKELRTDVHTLRNELQVAIGELLTSDKLSSKRGSWINDMLFIIDLLICELERLDSKSAIVKQAKGMLKRMQSESSDPSKSEARNTAETAVRDAQQTVRSAEHTVVEVIATEKAENGRKAKAEAAKK